MDLLKRLLVVFAAVALSAAPVRAVNDTLEVPLFESFEGVTAPSFMLLGGWHVTRAPDTVFVIGAVKDSLVNFPGTSSWPPAPSGNGYITLSGESTGTYVAPWDPAAQSAGNGGLSFAARADTFFTPIMAMNSYSDVVLSFQTWWEVEGFSFYSKDLMTIDFSTDGGRNFTFLDVLVDTLESEATDPAVPYSSGGLSADGVWIRKKYIVNSAAGGRMQFRFIFATVDSARNGFRGWMIDDMTIACDSLYPPYNFTASDTACGGVSLSWSDSSTAGGITYYIGRYDPGTVSTDTIVVDAAGPAFVDTFAVPGVVYDYWVWAVSTCGPSGPSNIDTGTAPQSPAAPGSVIASDSTCGAVNVSWIANMPEGNYYILTRDSDVIDSLPPGTEFYADSLAVPGVIYEYNVAAITPCDTVWAIPDNGFSIELPPDVSLFPVSDDRCADIFVRWQAVAGSFDYYVVYRGVDSIGTVSPTAPTEWYDDVVDSQVVYTYTVRTRNACGLSNIISTDTGMRIGLPPSVDSCTASDNLCQEVLVSWIPVTASGSVDEYVIFRDDDSIGTVADPGNSFRDSFATVDSVHLYSVQSRSGCGAAISSCSDSGVMGEAPPMPGAITASDSLCSFVSLSWDTTAGAFQEYIIYREGDSIGVVAKGSPTVFVDSLVDSMVISSYWLRTKSTCGYSLNGASNSGRRFGLPPTATACSASDSFCGRVTVTWSGATDPSIVDFYVVERDGVPIDTLVSPPYQVIDAGADSNVTHNYEVIAWNQCGRSIGSCSDSGRALTAPGPPTLFSATKEGCGEVVLTWGPPVAGGIVDGYRITRGAPPVVTEVGPDVFQYTDVPTDTELIYTLRAFNCEESAGVIDTGRTVGSIPSPPESCTVEVIDCDTLRITWAASPTATEGYVVLRDGLVRIDSVGQGVLSTSDAPPQDGVDYRYLIYALNSCGWSAEACTVTARIPGPVGSLPDSLCTASSDSCGGVYLSWSPPVTGGSDVEWFRIYSLPEGIVLDSVGAGVTEWIDTQIAYGDTSSYAIEAGNGCYVSAAMCTVSGARPPLPSAPEGCSASSDLCDRITVTWNMPAAGVDEGISQFKIYRKLSQSSGSFELRAAVGPALGENSWNDMEVEIARSYLYRVASVNTCGETVGACQVQGSIMAPRPAPALLQPDDEASGLDLPVIFSWSRETEATGYTLLVARDSAFAEIVIDTLMADTIISIGEIDFDDQYFWRVSSMNKCGSGDPSPTRTFGVDVAPGVELTAGSPDLPFGNGTDTTFADSVFVIRNMGRDTLDWWIEPTPAWVAFEPDSGTLAGGDSIRISASVASWRCGVAYDETVEVKIDPPREGRPPVRLFPRFTPVPRPAGDYNWDCAAGLDDAGSLLDVLLGLASPAAAESLGADANGDGRITVADLVFLGGELAEGEIARSGDGPTVSFFLTGDGAAVIALRSEEPFRALRLHGTVADALAVPIDRSSTMLNLEGDSPGRLSLFWYDDDPRGRTELALFRLGGIAPAAKTGRVDFRPIAVELLDTKNGTWRPQLDNTSLVPADIPSRLMVSAVRPNPFNALVTIDFALPRNDRATVEIFDIRGALVRVLHDGPLDAGPHTLRWNGETANRRDAATGIYFLRVRAGGEEVTKRLTLLR